MDTISALINVHNRASMLPYPTVRQREALAIVRDFIENLRNHGRLTENQQELPGINVQVAVLYQDGYWEEVVVRVPGTHTNMQEEQIGRIAQRYVNQLDEYDNAFGCYVTDPDYDGTQAFLARHSEENDE